MHYSQSHQYGSGNPDLGTGNPSGYRQANLGGSGPYTHLLRESDSALCLNGASTDTCMKSTDAWPHHPTADADISAMFRVTSALTTRTGNAQ
jgi:hypothetical protein